MRNRCHALVCLGGLLLGSIASAATPSAEQALKLRPVQKGVEYEQPSADDAAKCKIAARKADGQSGWIVEGPDGVVLRRFIDTNGDNVVDQWSYFKDGLEVYRDIDSNHNGKADQYRWFHTAGGRHGLDADENGTIEQWKALSAEELAAEVVAALATGDAQRFLRLALSEAELKTLGLGEARTKQLSERLAGLEAAFAKVAEEQKAVSATSKWLQFSGLQPGVVPAGTDGSKSDVTVYENALAVVSTDGKPSQLQLGTLVRVGDAWRLVDVPRPVAEGQTDVAATGLFFHSGAAKSAAQTASAGTSEGTQKLLGELEDLDKTAVGLTSAEDKAQYHARRGDLLEKIAEHARTPDEREMWMRQLADMTSAAVQSGAYPNGAKRLEALYAKLKQDEGQKQLAAYVRFRQLMSEYGQKLQAAGADISKVQTEWLKELEGYVADYPKAADAAEAILQLGMNAEYAGHEDEAKKWYQRATAEFGDSPAGRKAAGAVTRLGLVGKPLNLQGKGLAGDTVDVGRLRGKVIVVQFWATWCEPCKADISILKDLVGKYGRNGFAVVGVSLDSQAKEVADYVSENRLAWPQIFEEGGLDSRPANELGIHTVPTMLLVDQGGNVISRSIRAAEVEKELKSLLKLPETAGRNRGEGNSSR